ncbi:MAG: DUF4301 family protein [Bacteroidota bacterium]
MNQQDREQMQQKGIAPDLFVWQLQRFAQGFPPLKLLRPPSESDGVSRFEESEIEALIAHYEAEAPQLSICKFVPASGAASRMFRLLYQYRQGVLPPSENASTERFFAEIKRFAFYEDLVKIIDRNGLDLQRMLSAGEQHEILDFLLEDKGLGYGQLPKLLLRFHRYQGELRTPAMEHLVEGAHYAKGQNREAVLHFTVSAEHQALVQEHLSEMEIPYSARYATSFRLETSLQNPATDTIAVDLIGQPFRKADGSMLFRPGGHGALLENLNQLDADLVFIKNVDNVVPDAHKGPTYRYKKVIAGVLLRQQAALFALIDKLRAQEELSAELEEEALQLLKILGSVPRSGWQNEAPASKRTYLLQKLHRPIRVCGIIRTDRNTGGGPFWVENQQGGASLQIVETAQINLDDPAQAEVAAQSGYANITDLVCGLRDVDGQAFDLLQYRDDETGFITEKSLNGQQLRALELPGLWNGAMADWHTILVEVPISTFSPVKSVMDLLAPSHQNEAI